MYSNFAEAINKALFDALKDPRVLLMGEGVPDPKRIFGTTKGLKEAYPNQVFDQPVSENGATGVLIGAALNGFKCIQTHQRIDFSLYAMDQLINNAAKWRAMFGNAKSVPLTVRMIIGRGWGQGIQHSQNLEALYAHIPGLKVFVPHDPESAYRLTIEAINDPDPVILLEHKWIYNKSANTKKVSYENPYLTLVSWGAATSECEIALKNTENIDHIILEKLSPIDWGPIIDSVIQTDRLLVVSDDWGFGGIAAEIIAYVVERISVVQCSRINFPDYYVPASTSGSKYYYPEADQIVEAINEMTLSRYELPQRRKIWDADPFLQRFTSAL